MASSKEVRKVRFVDLPVPPRSAPLLAPVVVVATPLPVTVRTIPVAVLNMNTRQTRSGSPDLLQLLGRTVVPRKSKVPTSSSKRKVASKKENTKSKTKPQPKPKPRKMAPTPALSLSLESVSSVRDLLPKGKCSGKDVSALLKFIEGALDAQNQEQPPLPTTIEVEGIKYEIQAPRGHLSLVQPRAIYNTPLDVFCTMLDCLDEASATSLGLTCKAFWALHKLRYPSKNRLILTSNLAPNTNSLHLYEILDDWMGADRHFFAFPLGEGRIEFIFLTKQQCVDKLMEINRGVPSAEKKGCAGLWKGEVRTYANYQTAVFLLSHNKVIVRMEEINGKELEVGCNWVRNREVVDPPFPKAELCDNGEASREHEIGMEVRRGFF